MPGSDWDARQGRLFEAVQKYDYFLTGLAVAVLAYAVQSYVPGVAPIGRYLAPIAWVVLALAVYAGIMRQGRFLELVNVNLETEIGHERFDRLIEAMRHADAQVKAGGDPALSTHAFTEFQENENVLRVLYERQPRLAKSIRLWEIGRGLLLLLGLILLGVRQFLNL